MTAKDPEIIEVRREDWESVHARLARMEAAFDALRPAMVPDASDAEAASAGSLPRRKLLSGLAAAAAGGAVLTILDASPAAAAESFAGPVNVAQTTTTGNAFQVNQINSYNGAAALFNNAVPASGAINSAAYGAAAIGPNGMSARAAREGIGLSASSATGTAVKASLDAGAPPSSAAIQASTSNAIGMKVDVAGQGTAIVVSSAVGRGVIATSPRSQLTLRPYFPTAGPPTEEFGAAVAGELQVDGSGILWYCVAAGNPGTWRRLSGPTAAGSLHLLAAPARVYDSRPGTTPPNGSKTKLPAGGSRTLALTVNSSGVPSDAVAAAVTCLLVNTAAGAGNFTIWADGVPKPAANSMVWGGDAGRYSTPAVTALGPLAQCRVSSSLATDFVLDVVGYYR